MALLRSISERIREGVSEDTSRVAPSGNIRRSQPRLPDDFLITEVATADSAAERSRVAPGNGYVHISSLIDVCVRQHVLTKLHGINNFNTVTGAHRVMWALGRAAENHVRQSIIKVRQRNGIYGVWQCKCGQTKHQGFHPPERRCERCQSGLTEYREPALLDHDARAVGSPDLTLSVGNNYMAVVEIKSMNKKDFDALERPKADHVVQAAAYRRLYEQMGFTVHDEVIILYVKKEFQWGSPYKEFHVNVTSGHWPGLIDDMLADGREISDRTQSGTLPARTKCANVGCTRAKSCPVSTLCFSMD